MVVPWEPNEGVLDHSERIMAALTLIPTEDFAKWLSVNLQDHQTPTSLHLSVFSDALKDFSQFIEEIRFEIGLADIYLVSVVDEVNAMFKENSATSVQMSREVMALISPYMASTPTPKNLFENPKMSITKFRILGGWYAAQLLDSALLRCISALDRISIMLWCVAGMEFPKYRSGDLKLPSFRLDTLNKLSQVFDKFDIWPSLLDIVDDEILRIALPHRNGYVHSRRPPMLLHGEFSAVTDVGGQRRSVESIDAKEHMAQVLAFYLHILTPAASASQLLVRDLTKGLKLS